MSIDFTKDKISYHSNHWLFEVFKQKYGFLIDLVVTKAFNQSMKFRVLQMINLRKKIFFGNLVKYIQTGFMDIILIHEIILKY